jgi:hypothetical protein
MYRQENHCRSVVGKEAFETNSLELKSSRFGQKTYNQTLSFFQLVRMLVKNVVGEVEKVFELFVAEAAGLALLAVDGHQLDDRTPVPNLDAFDAVTISNLSRRFIAVKLVGNYNNFFHRP